MYVHFSTSIAERAGSSPAQFCSIRSDHTPKHSAQTVRYPRFGYVVALKLVDPILNILGLASPWLETDSADPVIADMSAKVFSVILAMLIEIQVLQHEMSNAAYCGLTSVMVPPPRGPAGVINYASVLNSILHESQVQISILFPLQEDPPGDVIPLDEGSVWQIWNTIQNLTNYNPRLSVALQIPKCLPSNELIRQWLAEPVRILLYSADVFLSNNKGYPVLSKAHQRLLNSFVKVA